MTALQRTPLFLLVSVLYAGARFCWLLLQSETDCLPAAVSAVLSDFESILFAFQDIYLADSRPLHPIYWFHPVLTRHHWKHCVGACQFIEIFSA